MNFLDRLGGVVFDIQKFRESRGEQGRKAQMMSHVPPALLRDKLIEAISELCYIVEAIDHAEMHGTNPRIADECGAISKDGFGQFWMCTYRKGHPPNGRIGSLSENQNLGRQVTLCVKPTGITLAGWHCPVTACGVFNSEEKEQRSECKSCGAKVKVER